MPPVSSDKTETTRPDSKKAPPGSDHSIGTSATTHDGTTAALYQDSWGSSLLHKASSLWHKAFGGDTKQAISIDDVNSLGSGSLTFDNIFAAAKPSQAGADATAPNTDAKNTNSDLNAGKTGGVLSDIGGWFSEAGKRVGDTVGSVFDWFKSSSFSDGSQRTIAARDGTVKYDGTTSSGERVQVSDNQQGIHADVNGVKIDQNKDGAKDTHYQGQNLSGGNKDGVQSVKNKDGTEVDWDAKKNQGEYKDASGKVIFEFGSLQEGQEKLDHYVKYHLKEGESLTQLDQGSAAGAADQELHNMQRNGGANPPETKMYVDKDGDYAVVRKDGMIIKTFKNGTVEFDKFDKDSKETHSLQIRMGEDGRRHAYTEDPNTHQFTQEVDLHSQHLRLPKGLTLGPDATVQINGQQVVSADGVVHNGQTQIQVTAGTMTTPADKGTVTVNAGNGQSTVDNPASGKITANADGKFTNSDPHAGFNSWDPDQGTIRAFQQPDGSGAVLGPQGIQFREPDGQITDIGNDGAVKSCDRDGLNLFNIDYQGDVSLFDGANIDFDGHVYDDSGDDYGYGWSDAAQAADAVEDAVQESTTDSAISESSSAMSAVGSEFAGGSAVSSSDVSDLMSADGALSQAQGSLDWDDVELKNAISNQRASLAGMLTQAQTMAALDAELKSRGLSDLEIAQAQKDFHNKTMDFAGEEAEDRHHGGDGKHGGDKHGGDGKNTFAFHPSSEAEPTARDSQIDDDALLRRTA